MDKRTKTFKNGYLLLIIILIISTISQNVYGERPKVGLVLMGGGAKGFAHVGVLKVIEEVGIPIDYIAGTSMGAIIGGLYSIGYDADAIDSLIQEQDWLHLITDDVYRYNLSNSVKEKSETFMLSLDYELGGIFLPQGIIKGHNILNLLVDLTTNYHENQDFKKLPIPFHCVAADLYSGDEIVLKDGSLPMAMRASMAIPGFFSPVPIDSLLLIDGGVLNNFPVDVVKEMGADIVIGVHFDKNITKDDLTGSLIDFWHHLDNFMGKDKYAQNIKDTDIPIKINLGKYNVASFRKNEIDSIISIGEAVARANINSLFELKEQLKLPKDSMMPKIENSYIGQDSLKLNSIKIEGLLDSEAYFVLKNFPVNLNTTKEELHSTIADIYGTELFTKVHYRLENPQPPYDLIFEIEKIKLNKLNIGLRFDTSDRASILLNTAVKLKRKNINTTLDITTRLNSNPYLTFDYSLYRSMSYIVSLKLKTSFNDMNIYNKGDIAYNLGYYTYGGNVNLSGFYFHKIKFQLGTNFEYYKYSYELTKSLNPSLNLESKPYISYYINGNYDVLNRKVFPTRGAYFDFNYQLVTTNLYKLDNENPLHNISFSFSKPIKIDDKSTITGNIIGRTLLGDNVPFIFSNMVGGQWNSHYTAQQIALEGLRGMEIMEKSVLKMELSYRYNFHRKHSLQFDFKYVFQDDKPVQIFNDKAFWNATIAYNHSTIVGPIIVRLNYSDRIRKVYPYINVGFLF